MKQILVLVDQYEGGTFDHKLAEQGADPASYILVQVTDKQFNLLNELKEAADDYHNLVALLYDKGMKALQKEEEKRKCKYRIRPGKWCGEDVKPGSDRCIAHFGLKNKPNKFQVEVRRGNDA